MRTQDARRKKASNPADEIAEIKRKCFAGELTSEQAIAALKAVRELVAA